MRSNLLLVLIAVVCGCSRESPAGNENAAPTSSVMPTAAAPSARVFPSSTISTKFTPPGREVEDPVHRELRTARITAMAVQSWSRPGFFQATLERPDSAGSVQVTLALALDQQPIALRRSLALERLARALEMRVVPATVIRRVTTGELGDLFANDNETRTYLTAHASIQNDGTVDALLMAPSRGDASTAWRMMSRREIVLEEAPEARSWANAVSSAEPLPNENKALLRDYVETIVLDYLSGNVLRRSVQFDEGASEIVLAENGGAFPQKSFASGETRLLDRVKPVMRFPKTLRDALVQLDRQRCLRIFMPGKFDSWLLSQRTLMLLEERRATLLTLLESRIAAYGEQVVLSL